MIEFNKCTIDPSGKKLIIEASVKDKEYYEDVYIHSITIDTEDTFHPLGISQEPIYFQTFESTINTAVYTEGSSEPQLVKETVYNNKHISVELTPSILNLQNFNNNVFFVFVRATGTPSSDTPCGEDNIYTKAIVVNLTPIYEEALLYTKELNNNCSIPKKLIDIILRYKALDLAIKSGESYTVAEYWKKLFKNRNNYPVNNNTCKCNGNY